jgi:HPr kinase/phosphorylase
MTVTVQDFFNEGEALLSLEVESGERNFDKVIHEKAINRPGLALAGFMQYFANRRIQVMGLSEFAYLKSLSEKLQRERLDTICRKNIPCIVLSRNRHIPPSVREAAEDNHVPVLRTSMITSQFINAATITMERLLAPTMNFQGTMVDILGIGVLIEGPAGIGKSETALELIERGHSLVADDITRLQRIGVNDIVGSPLELTRYHMEIRGLGIVHIPSLFGVAAMRREMKLDIIIKLHPWDPENDDDRTGLDVETRELMGVEIPHIQLPVAPGRDMAHVIEVAALNQKMKLLGHDAAKELDDRLMDNLIRKGKRPSR